MFLSQELDAAAKSVDAFFEAAQTILQEAQQDVLEEKENCKRKMELDCDSCMALKCQQAEDDCKGFMDEAGKWIGKALSSVSDVSRFLVSLHTFPVRHLSV